ncbi:unnamed protein product [Lactuca virosa]|uniref:Sulfotransferase n=1 Tax=Lactuca virosa TaxID=75947 RepID=A0AAU9NS67_9ASTR|nr:unnamed protein product [Lactuca virosa]
MSIPDVSSLSLVSESSSENDEHEKANLALLLDSYKEKLSQFPKEKGWMGQEVFMYQGFWYTSDNAFSIERMMAVQEIFQAHSSDIYVITQPKCGTTWIKALVYAIVNRTKYKNINPSDHPLNISNPHKCVPFLETEIIIKVYMCRNPKDVLVSWFHFANQLKDKSRTSMTIGEMLDVYAKGFMPYGPYWDHVIEYYKASSEEPTKVLFLTYEDTKIDTQSKVKRLAEFLGYPFTEEEVAKGVVEEIVTLCSFENLKEVNKNGDFITGVPNNTFFREGKVGGWSNYLTKEMSQILDDITTEKFQGLDISF